MIRIAQLSVLSLVSLGCVTSPQTNDIYTVIDKPQSSVSSEEVVALVSGSQIEINYHTSVMDSRQLGTVLKADSEGVALMNCHYFSVYKGPKDGAVPVKNLPHFNRLYRKYSRK